MPQSRLVWPIEATLGEGPAWIDDMLWFVDIKAGAIHRYDPAADARDSYVVGGAPSFIVPTADGALLVGNRGALHLFDGEALAPPLATVSMPVHNRTNDATVDALGRLWFGTMDDEETRPSGAVHVFDGASISAVGGDCTITNGPAISPDGRHLYHVDTLAGTIHRFDIATDTLLRDGTLFATIAPEDGNPDGVTVDSEACVWVGLWGGWEARRYAPDGTLLLRVALPCANVTKIAFGGPDLRTAYVTTARVGLSDAELAEQPLAGGLFAFDAPAPGLPLASVRIAR
ncbi:SMP-30/gluconolactonase/LRE family protein [Sphingomonas glacialis]|uniref:SMP-30/gluconolactonase/LRE family protein n=1 Tax=Sphingomonas glacialis TaxID=658225 RepID=UPI001F5000C6|nr:SMP-30/gluconolactonase/LRE family protein [Sphingomonas glacialis]